MARMLGRYQVPGCCPGTKAGRDPGPDCSGGGSLGTRAARRLEQREFARSLMPETDAEWLRTLGPCFTDVGIDCQHGCSGSPSCGSEACTFICHEG
jgi:hypothetical protein